MIWGETTERKRARLNAEEPQPWFAWHPVRFLDGRSAWLTTVLRHRHRGIYWWIYQPAKAAPLPDSDTGGKS